MNPAFSVSAAPTTTAHWMRDWPWSAPRPRGRWTVRNGDRYALVDPETGDATPVEPRDDPELPGVAATLDAGGRLVAYRHRRRAVVAHADHFTKIVRPSRLADAAARHAVGSRCAGAAGDGVGPGFEVPRVAATHPDGRVELTTVPGRSLHHRLRTGGHVPLDRVAAALVSLHDASGSTLSGITVSGADPFLPAATVDDPMRWVDIVSRIEPELRPQLESAAASLPPLDDDPPPGRGCVVHTDLHDKNVFIDGDRIGIIDLDGIAIGTPEIDVANLAVHLELRGLQAGRPAAGRDRARAFVAHYESQRPLDRDRLDALGRHTWFRLACLYRCRASPGPNLSFGV